MKRISIIGSVGIPANYGGFETFVENIVEHLNSKLHITVYCSSYHYPQKQKTYKGATLKYIPLKANGWQSILYDGVSLFRSAYKADICLILGVSGSIFFPILRFFSRCKIVCNIDGIEWKRAKWSTVAKIYLKFSEWIAIYTSHTVIADSLVIKKFIIDNYCKESIFIPYGGDHIRVHDFGTAFFDEFSIKKNDYFLNISRIEPENNPEIILQAFSCVPNQTLVMIGNWQGSNYSIYLRNAYKKFTNIRMLDAMFDRQAEKNYIRANCKAYVHGHSVGGTSPALVEALVLNRIPVCFDVSFNRSTCDNLGYYFKSANDLSKIIRDFDNNKDTLALHANLRLLCDRRYHWKDITGQYYEVFESLNR